MVSVIIMISVVSIQIIFLFFYSIRTISSSLRPGLEPRAQKDPAVLGD